MTNQTVSRPHYTTKLILSEESNGYTHEPLGADRRFWAKVDRRGPDECWPWLSATDRAGYARFGSVTRYGTNIAHRIAWMLVNGPIPDGLDLDHVRARGCVLRSCVNVNHLEPVTHFENCRRGSQAQQTHCVNGHPFDSENLVMRFRRSGAPYRQCKTCLRIRAKQQTAKQKGAAQTTPATH